MNAYTKQKKITVLVPCYNEENGVGSVIDGFAEIAGSNSEFEIEVIIIDNNSKDKTVDVALAHGAKVIHEYKQGKGHAIRTGFSNVPADTDYVVMLDGDNTYRPDETLRLVELIRSGFCNVAIGSRLGGRISVGSMTKFNRFGNWIFSHLVRGIYRVNVTDVLTGYFAWTREVIERLNPHLVSAGYTIEMEMITKMARLGEEIYSVPISYDARAGQSNLNPIADGMRILTTLLRNLIWRPTKKVLTRIAFVSDAIMPYNKGGKEKRLYEISKRLVSENCEVHIYTMKWWDGPKLIRRDGVYLHAISKLRPLYFNKRRSISQAIMFSMSVFKLMFEKFDVMDVDQMPFFPLFIARIVTWLRRKKLHATWHEVWGREYWLEYMKGPAGILGSMIENLALEMPDVIISNSFHTTRSLRAAGFEREIKTVPLGVDLENVYAARASGSVSDIIYIGHLLKHKNVDILIKAVAIVKKSISNITCQIVGKGPELLKIKKLIKRLKLTNNITITENIEKQSGLYALMKSSKMLVLPSSREGFGLVVVEANAAGLPVITTSSKYNAAKDLINEGVNGFIVKLNEKKIAEKIIQVLKNREHMNPTCGIERYDWNLVAQQVKDFIAV